MEIDHLYTPLLTEGVCLASALVLSVHNGFAGDMARQHSCTDDAATHRGTSDACVIIYHIILHLGVALWVLMVVSYAKKMMCENNHTTMSCCPIHCTYTFNANIE